VLTFGFSPFFNLQRLPFHGSMLAHVALTFLFDHGNNLYQFQNLAFSKARCVDVSWNLEGLLGPCGRVGASRTCTRSKWCRGRV
jgi:hypothetical protein